MQLPPTNFARTLDSEFRRIAEQEEKTMEEMVTEVSRLLNRSIRQIYNYRSGKWSLEARHVPTLCRRFNSLALVNALVAECNDVKVVIPDGFDLTRMTSRTVRQNLEYYERFLDAFESDGIQPHELAGLRELMERVVYDAYQFLEIAAADCDRRTRTVNHSPVGN